jgi:hypothetical protein
MLPQTGRPERSVAMEFHDGISLVVRPTLTNDGNSIIVQSQGVYGKWLSEDENAAEYSRWSLDTSASSPPGALVLWRLPGVTEKAISVSQAATPATDVMTYEVKTAPVPERAEPSPIYMLIQATILEPNEQDGQAPGAESQSSAAESRPAGAELPAYQPSFGLGRAKPVARVAYSEYLMPLKAGWALDLDLQRNAGGGDLKFSGAVRTASIAAEWPPEFDVAWSGDSGGALVTDPKSPTTRLMVLPDAMDFDQAVTTALRRDRLSWLQTHQDKAPGGKYRFCAVLTDRGEVAVVEIVKSDPSEARLRVLVGAPEDLRSRSATQPSATLSLPAESSPATQPGGLDRGSDGRP